MAKRERSMADKFDKVQAKRKENLSGAGLQQPIAPVQKVVMQKSTSKDWKKPGKEYDRTNIIIEEDLLTRIKMAVATKSNKIKFDSELINAILSDFFDKHPSNNLKDFLKESGYYRG